MYGSLSAARRCFILSYRKLLEKLRYAKWIFLGLLGKGLLSTCLKFLALSLVRVPALKGGAAVLLMVYGLLNDDSPPDRTGAERNAFVFVDRRHFSFDGRRSFTKAGSGHKRE